MIIYHITTRTAWDDAKVSGQYTAPSLVNEGFIHASTRDQVVGTANLFFQGQNGLVLLMIEAGLLTSKFRFDPVTAHGGIQEFPHIYGPINLAAVISVIDFPPSPDGSFPFPSQA